jgi:hypothetical protein
VRRSRTHGYVWTYQGDTRVSESVKERKDLRWYDIVALGPGYGDLIARTYTLISVSNS